MDNLRTPQKNKVRIVYIWFFVFLEASRCSLPRHFTSLSLFLPSSSIPFSLLSFSVFPSLILIPNSSFYSLFLLTLSLFFHPFYLSSLPCFSLHSSIPSTPFPSLLLPSLFHPFYPLSSPPSPFQLRPRPPPYTRSAGNQNGGTLAPEAPLAPGGGKGEERC